MNGKLNMFKYSIKMLADMPEHLQESHLKPRTFKKNHIKAGNGCTEQSRVPDMQETQKKHTTKR